MLTFLLEWCAEWLPVPATLVCRLKGTSLIVLSSENYAAVTFSSRVLPQFVKRNQYPWQHPGSFENFHGFPLAIIQLYVAYFCYQRFHLVRRDVWLGICLSRYLVVPFRFLWYIFFINFYWSRFPYDPQIALSFSCPFCYSISWFLFLFTLHLIFQFQSPSIHNYIFSSPYLKKDPSHTPCSLLYT